MTQYLEDGEQERSHFLQSPVGERRENREGGDRVKQGTPQVTIGHLLFFNPCTTELIRSFSMSI